MPESLRLLLSDPSFRSDRPAHSGGVEAACAAGLVSDAATLDVFLQGRLRTAAATNAYAAAAVCARAATSYMRTGPGESLWRSVEAELDARMPSPAVRAASRHQGGHVLRLAQRVVRSPILDALGRSTVACGQRPHHAVALGAVAAVAGASPLEAAEAAAHASLGAAAAAAQRLLSLDPGVVDRLYGALSGDVRLLAAGAAAAAARPLSELPAFGSPSLDWLAEAHSQLAARSFAS